jgi:DNA-directed RNA polymerase subunit RPC12/RpoP
MVFDQNARIELTCPNCGGKWDETLGDLRAGPVRCPGCNFEIDTREFVKGTGGAARG